MQSEQWACKAICYGDCNDDPGDSLRPVSFQRCRIPPRLYVALADRSKEASEKDSRNGLGKTTLLEIIHFCLGGVDKKSRLMAEPLKNWTFTLELDCRGKPYTVSRNTGEPRWVILDGDFTDWPVKPRFNKDTGNMVISNPDWNKVLGWLMFDLPQEEEDSRAYHPSFRSLITYFVRRGRSAFSDPFVHEPKQKEWQTKYIMLFFSA